MAHVIEFPTPKRLMVQEFSAERFAAQLRGIVELRRDPEELLETIEVPPGDPATKSMDELLQVTTLHKPYCCCSYCEELVLREMEREV